MQFGKDSNMSKFRDIQLSAGFSLGLLDEINIPAFLFPGLTIGKRTVNNKKQYRYNDIQIQIAGLFSLGLGKGTITIDNKKIPRHKMWLGSFFSPVAYTMDNYTYNKNKIKNKGIIVVVPFPYFSGDFKP